MSLILGAGRATSPLPARKVTDLLNFAGERMRQGQVDGGVFKVPRRQDPGVVDEFSFGEGRLTMTTRDAVSGAAESVAHLNATEAERLQDALFTVKLSNQSAAFDGFYAGAWKAAEAIRLFDASSDEVRLAIANVQPGRNGLSLPQVAGRPVSVSRAAEGHFVISAGPGTPGVAMTTSQLLALKQTLADVWAAKPTTSRSTFMQGLDDNLAALERRAQRRAGDTSTFDVG